MMHKYNKLLQVCRIKLLRNLVKSIFKIRSRNF